MSKTIFKQFCPYSCLRPHPEERRSRVTKDEDACYSSMRSDLGSIATSMLAISMVAASM